MLTECMINFVEFKHYSVFIISDTYKHYKGDYIVTM